MQRSSFTQIAESKRPAFLSVVRSGRSQGQIQSHVRDRLRARWFRPCVCWSSGNVVGGVCMGHEYQTRWADLATSFTRNLSPPSSCSVLHVRSLWNYIMRDPAPLKTTMSIQSALPLLELDHFDTSDIRLEEEIAIRVNDVDFVLIEHCQVITAFSSLPQSRAKHYRTSLVSITTL